MQGCRQAEARAAAPWGQAVVSAVSVPGVYIASTAECSGEQQLCLTNICCGTKGGKMAASPVIIFG